MPLHFSRLDLPADMIGGLSVNTLAWLKEHPEDPSLRVVDVACSKCKKIIQAPAIFTGSVACDDCRAEYQKKELEDRFGRYWHRICPPSFEETDIHHAGFPKTQFEMTKDYQGKESLIFLGDTGAGKTRLAVLLLRRCLYQFQLYVGILWPEQLKAVRHTHDRLEMIEQWGSFDVLLMDDSLLTGAQDERIADFLKDLVDYRARFKRVFILTSQVGGKEFAQQAEKFGELTPADVKRIEALTRRIKEGARVIPFQVTVDEGLPF